MAAAAGVEVAVRMSMALSSCREPRKVKVALGAALSALWVAVPGMKLPRPHYFHRTSRPLIEIVGTRLR